MGRNTGRFRKKIIDMKTDTLIFNLFQENTYIVYDETGQALVIDPGFNTEEEKNVFDDHVEKNNIKIERCVITHPHPDHFLGGKHIIDKYGVTPEIYHTAGKLFHIFEVYMAPMGFMHYQSFVPQYTITEDSVINFGNSSMSVLYTPGHADASVCFYCEKAKILFSGDVLFMNGIGRTDMPTGDFDTLIKSIRDKIFVLPDDVKVYSGHGDVTEVGYEKRSNPYF